MRNLKIPSIEKHFTRPSEFAASVFRFIFDGAQFLNFQVLELLNDGDVETVLGI